jgi:TMEM175 potassium channel family protein
MGKNRLEAFSDGVIAILITIMVLELKAPPSVEWDALRPLLPVFLSYVLSFVFLGIYWNNHHHLLQAVTEVNGAVLWANLHLLFWLSLVPFVTHWNGSTEFAALPVAIYGGVFLCAALAYYVLVRTLIIHHGKDSTLATAVGGDFKGLLSIALYVSAIPLAFVHSWIACGIYVAVAVIWLIPDRRIERALAPGERQGARGED